MNGTTNLIMGYCARLPFTQLEPFIASLRHTTFAGDVCLLIEDVAAETVDRLRAVGVIVERAGPSAQQSMTAMSSRFFSYLDYLIRRGDRFANVMLVDPANSIFQADPFTVPLSADIVYSGERRRIGETPAVRDAVVQAYGEAVAHNIRDGAVGGFLHHTRLAVRHAALSDRDDAPIGRADHADHRCDRSGRAQLHRPHASAGRCLARPDRPDRHGAAYVAR